MTASQTSPALSMVEQLPPHLVLLIVTTANEYLDLHPHSSLLHPERGTVQKDGQRLPVDTLNPGERRQLVQSIGDFIAGTNNYCKSVTNHLHHNITQIQLKDASFVCLGILGKKHKVLRNRILAILSSVQSTATLREPSYSYLRALATLSHHLTQDFRDLFLYNLLNQNPRIRATCLHILTVIAGCSQWFKHTELELLARRFLNDPDPEVRVQSLLSILSLPTVSHNLHNDLIPLLKDDSAIVRRQAIITVGTMAPSASWAFTLLASMINDPDLGVRVKVCEVLGGVNASKNGTRIDKQVFLQAFSKEKVVDGKISTSDADMQLDPESLPTEPIIKSLTSYAFFLHALEDSFSSVRLAAIHSIRRLCLSFISTMIPIAVGIESTSTGDMECVDTAKDFLLDMLNDEILSVRIAALCTFRDIAIATHLASSTRSTTARFNITTPSPVNTLLTITEESLVTLLTSLHDSYAPSRILGRHIISLVRVPTPTAFQKVVEALAKSLIPYPSDIRGVIWCLNHVGTHHSEFVESWIPVWLGLDKRFLSKERAWDVLHTIRLSIIFGAVTSSPLLAQKLPHYIIHKHYPLLRDKFPGCITDLTPSDDWSEQLNEMDWLEKLRICTTLELVQSVRMALEGLSQNSPSELLGFLQHYLASLELVFNIKSHNNHARRMFSESLMKRCYILHKYLTPHDLGWTRVIDTLKLVARVGWILSWPTLDLKEHLDALLKALIKMVAEPEDPIRTLISALSQSHDTEGALGQFLNSITPPIITKLPPISPSTSYRIITPSESSTPTQFVGSVPFKFEFRAMIQDWNDMLSLDLDDDDEEETSSSNSLRNNDFDEAELGLAIEMTYPGGTRGIWSIKRYETRWIHGDGEGEVDICDLSPEEREKNHKRLLKEMKDGVGSEKSRDKLEVVTNVRIIEPCCLDPYPISLRLIRLLPIPDSASYTIDKQMLGSELVRNEDGVECVRVDLIGKEVQYWVQPKPC